MPQSVRPFFRGTRTVQRQPVRAPVRSFPSTRYHSRVPPDLFAFVPFELDAAARRLTKSGEPVALSPRQFDLLHLLVARAGQLLSKDALIETAWSGIAMTDNSLEQAISSLRRILVAPDTTAYIETQARRGYRFAA